MIFAGLTNESLGIVSKMSNEYSAHSLFQYKKLATKIRNRNRIAESLNLLRFAIGIFSMLLCGTFDNKSSLIIGFFILLLSAVACSEENERIVVTGKRLERDTVSVQPIHATSDVAAFMHSIPGGGVNLNGSLSGLPQYRGMFGPRLGFRVE